MAAANTTLLTCRVGHALERPVEEYVGRPQTALLRGFTQAVTYHEILWATQFFGVKAEHLSTSTTQLEAATRPERARNDASGGSRGARSAQPERKTGTVKSWNVERGFGFVTDTAGEDFHLSPRHVVYPEDLPGLLPGQQVAFVAGDRGKGRSREALALLLAGRDAQGYITGLPADRGYGWIRVADLAGNVHAVYMSLDKMTAPVERGMVVDFRVEIGPRGAVAADVHPVEGAA